MSTVAAPAKTGNAREAILDAATRVMRQKGYGATSVDDLCREAGVTKGAFFHHFGSMIASGTNDIQRNIISKRVLELP